tara:strand:- start:121 stop:498 length:378 start_codon:yes stop_codon:yes gene_type:complete
MNLATIKPASHLMLLGLMTIVALFLTPDARADHDHPHIYVTLVDYLGHDASSGDHTVKVATHEGDHHHEYILHFHTEAVGRLRGHNGEKLQISLSEDGQRWERLTLNHRGEVHGPWTIHSKHQVN